MPNDSKSMKLVFDTNVVVDVIGARAPFADAFEEAIAASTRDGWHGAITANTITDIYFILQKFKPDRDSIKTAMMEFIGFIDVLDTNRELCIRAFQSDVPDFEDALLVESALDWSADLIVTRNTKDFANSPIEAISPAELRHRFPE